MAHSFGCIVVNVLVLRPSRPFPGGYRVSSSDHGDQRRAADGNARLADPGRVTRAPAETGRSRRVLLGPRGGGGLCITSHRPQGWLVSTVGWLPFDRAAHWRAGRDHHERHFCVPCMLEEEEVKVAPPPYRLQNSFYKTELTGI